MTQVGLVSAPGDMSSQHSGQKHESFTSSVQLLRNHSLTHSITQSISQAITVIVQLILNLSISCSQGDKDLCTYTEDK